MFKVKSKRSGNVYNVYAVDGYSFFIYREAKPGRWKEGWAWVNSINYTPLEESDG